MNPRNNRLFAFLATLFFLSSLPFVSFAQFPKIPKIPKFPKPEQISIPGLDRMFKEDPPVTTGLAHAVTEIPFLDDYDPQHPIPMEWMPRGTESQFLLFPGVFTFEAQSYCLHAGTYAPSKGDGYLYAPLVGPKGAIVRNILKRSVAHPQIPQHSIQVLIWSILARTKVRDMPAEMRNAASVLLTSQEIEALNGGAMGYIPDSVRAKVFANLPEEVRRIYEVENRLRQMMTQGNATYEEFERVAVLTGSAPPGKGSREVPRGRWSYQPAGYFVRYIPSGYPHTHVDVYVPEAFTVERDAKGRITLVADRQGDRIELQYDENLKPVSIEGDSQVHAFAFRAIRYVEGVPGGQARGGSGQKWENVGWTLVGVPEGNGHPAAASSRFNGLANRYSQANRRREEFENLTRQVNEAQKTNASHPALPDLMDLAHLRAALLAAVGNGSERDAPGTDFIGRVTNAWQSAFAGQFKSSPSLVASLHGAYFSGAGDQGAASGNVAFDPSGSVAVPGDTSRQRLAQSNRCKLEGSAASEDLALRQALADALRKHGATSATADDINVRETGQFIQWNVRIGRGNRVLPSLKCIEQEIAKGNVPQGSVEGAPRILLGGIQKAGDTTRVTARIVNTETSEILDAGKGDATGTDNGAIERAAEKALDHLGIPFGG